MDFLQIKNKSKQLNPWERKCAQRLKQFVGPEDTYTMRLIPDGSLNEMIDASDRYRFGWLKNNPEGCYVDLDCYVHRIPIGNPGTIWMPITIDRVDIFFIYVNGDTKYIRDNFKPIRKGDCYSWPASELKRMLKEGKFNAIPNVFYDHKFQSLNAMIEANEAVRCQAKI